MQQPNLDERLNELSLEWKKATLMEDIKFRCIAKSTKAVEEILRTILKDEQLVVLKTVEQKNRSNKIFHGVIHKEFKYDKLPKIISIMICDFDEFKQGKAIYEIHRIINDTNQEADNGIREIYVNVNAKEKDEKTSELFKILKKLNYKNEKVFPELSRTKNRINVIGGQRIYSGLTKKFMDYAELVGEERGIKKGKTEGMQQTFKMLINNGILTKAEAKKQMALMK